MRVELYPVYSVYIHLGELVNIDLSLRGYYQVRISPKPSTVFTSIDISCADKSKFSQSEAPILPSSITNGCGVSRTVELTYIDEELKIGDLFHLKVQLPPQTSFNKTHKLLLDIELWSMDRHRPPRFEYFDIDSRRTIEIELNPSKLTAAARPLAFEYKAPSYVSLAVFASLVSIMPRRRKAPPDPPISDRLREYHGALTETLSKAINSNEAFIKKNSCLLSKYINIDSLSTVSSPNNSDSIPSLISRLESSERPWATLEASAVQLSTRLDVLFQQLVQLFGSNDGLLRGFYQQFADWRHRLLGDAFFFTEKPLSTLRASSLPSTTAAMHGYVLKGKYLERLPQYAIYCPATDSPVENCPVIFEDCFGINCPTSSRRLQSPVDVDVPSPIPVDATASIESKLAAAIQQGLEPGGASMRRDSQVMKSLRKLTVAGRRKSSESLKTKRQSKQRHSTGTVHSLVKTSEDPNEPSPTNEIERAASGRDNDSDSLANHDADTARAMEPSTSDASGTSSFTNGGDTDEMNRLVELVREREHIKNKLRTHFTYDGCLYSQMAYHAIRPVTLPRSLVDIQRQSSARADGTHLVVFVHGLEGSSDDLMLYGNALRVAAPATNLNFLFSSSNQCETWTDFETMSRNLLAEVHDFVKEQIQPVNHISFIAHSMGGVIVRAALGRADAQWMHDRLHTLMTINTPHLGLAYVTRGVHWGMQLIQWWKRSRSMEQLTLRDALSFHDSFLFRLSQNGAFSHFKNVLVVGAPHDMFVPSHSALLEPCKHSSKDPSALGAAYRDMLSNIYSDIVDGCDSTNRTFVRYSSFHNCETARSNTITGRAAHIAAVEDDTFIEKIISVSALRFFVS